MSAVGEMRPVMPRTIAVSVKFTSTSATANPADRPPSHPQISAGTITSSGSTGSPRRSMSEMISASGRGPQRPTGSALARPWPPLLLLAHLDVVTEHHACDGADHTERAEREREHRTGPDDAADAVPEADEDHRGDHQLERPGESVAEAV